MSWSWSWKLRDEQNKHFRKFQSPSDEDIMYYGPNYIKVDQLQQHTDIFLKKLVVNEKQQMLVMQRTIDQANSNEWKEKKGKE